MKTENPFWTASYWYWAFAKLIYGCLCFVIPMQILTFTLAGAGGVRTRANGSARRRATFKQFVCLRVGPSIGRVFMNNHLESLSQFKEPSIASLPFNWAISGNCACNCGMMPGVAISGTCANVPSWYHARWQGGRIRATLGTLYGLGLILKKLDLDWIGEIKF